MSNESYKAIGIARSNGVVVYTTTARERGVLRIFPKKNLFITLIKYRILFYAYIW